MFSQICVVICSGGRRDDMKWVDGLSLKPKVALKCVESNGNAIGNCLEMKTGVLEISGCTSRALEYQPPTTTESLPFKRYSWFLWSTTADQGSRCLFLMNIPPQYHTVWWCYDTLAQFV